MGLFDDLRAIANELNDIKEEVTAPVRDLVDEATGLKQDVDKIRGRASGAINRANSAVAQFERRTNQATDNFLRSSSRPRPQTPPRPTTRIDISDENS